MIHAEHAELISALRAEVEHLTQKCAKVAELEAVIAAQDRLLTVADREARRILEILEKQEQLILDLRNRLGDYTTD